ncbi:MAG: bifunctional (p)ppGpp synthetase/guanosine-3',5'-bis(diphosphate) 3'-pyrophosphohydrolase [Bacteroidales bacterium]|nr:bifunctional (p)ppGpp synthetase/guanosine-3',5'-bis(diphosphate) 3'-pyrophosphohydrolase [Bacteroidales bacterium]
MEYLMALIINQWLQERIHIIDEGEKEISYHLNGKAGVLQSKNINWKRLIARLGFKSDKQLSVLEGISNVYSSWLFELNENDQKIQNSRIEGICKLIVDEIGLGFVSVQATILLPVYQGGGISEDDLLKLVDKSVVDILHGIKKLESLDMSKTEIHSENFIQLLLSISSDVRVILLKTAERLYCLRQVTSTHDVNDMLLAREARDLYAPIAHRLGLYLIKSEFEEAAMKILLTDQYQDIAKRLNESKKSRSRYIQSFIAPIEQMLKSNGINCDIKGRPKSIHSIWKKMSSQGVEFDEVYDLFAIRIILQSSGASEKADCWQVYSLITDLYQPNPNRLRDWISSPKPNGYESLHTTVIGPNGKWVELQIRTKRMDEIAEYGHAAHWKYKENLEDSSEDDWLGRIRLALEKSESDKDDDKQSAKTELYSNQIYIFTPNGDLIKLRSGSTVLDFAFAVHTSVGYHCTGATLNGEIVPIKQELINGDLVEILTSNQQRPKIDWLNWVVSSKARSRIKRALKEAEYQNADKGRDTLKRKFEQWRIRYDVTAIDRLVNHLKLKNPLELYQQVAVGKLDLNQIKDWLKAKDPAGYNKSKPESNKSIDSFVKSTVQDDDCLILDDTLQNVDFKLARCCNPIFGDEVFGFVTVSGGTKIHRLNCPNAKQMISRYPYRVIKVNWTSSHGDQAHYSVNVRIAGMDDIGIINEVSRVISSDLKVNMRAMNISSRDGFFTGQITLVVQDKKHLEVIFGKLKRVKGVLTVQRSDEFL